MLLFGQILSTTQSFSASRRRHILTSYPASSIVFTCMPSLLLPTKWTSLTTTRRRSGFTHARDIHVRFAQKLTITFDKVDIHIWSTWHVVFHLIVELSYASWQTAKWNQLSRFVWSRNHICANLVGVQEWEEWKTNTSIYLTWDNNKPCALSPPTNFTTLLNCRSAKERFSEAGTFNLYMQIDGHYWRRTDEDNPITRIWLIGMVGTRQGNELRRRTFSNLGSQLT